MAISSVLTPEKITGRPKASIGSAQNFISGGSPLGSSVVSSAANKIVGFQRSAAVRPVIPDINSIISSISSNIVNNLNNTINKSSDVLQNNVENKIQSFKTDTFNIIKSIENRVEKISVINEQKNEIIDYINNTSQKNKEEIIRYINNINFKNKNEIINYINQNQIGSSEYDKSPINKLNSFIISNKKELIQYIDNTNLENKKELINLVNQNKEQIFTTKNDIINYIKNETTEKSIVEENIKNISLQITNKVNDLSTKLIQDTKNLYSNITENKTEIDKISTSFNTSKQEIINFIEKTNIENKQEIIERINENKKEIIVNKTDAIDYINKTVLQSNIVNQIENLETSVNEIKGDISQVQINKSPDLNMGGITTQFREVVQNITENVNETVSRTVTNLTTEYRKKVQEVDSAKPTGILQKFIDAYNTAFGFAQYFSNRKNISKLKDNLNAVKESFTESFNTAKLLRQVIFKIVKQLSNLPKATAGGGGFNLDVDIPGPRLKQSLPRGASRIGRVGKIAALGAGALSAGVAGGAVVNALADSGQVQPVVGEPMIPGAIVDGFSAIVERFEKAVENLAKGATGQKKSEAKSKPPSGGGSPQSPSSSPGSSPGAMPSGPSSYSPGTIPKEVSKDTEFTKGVSELAKKYNVPEDYLYAVMGFETGGTFSPSITNKAGSGATGLIQFMPETAKGLGTSTGELAKMSRTQQLKYVDKYFSDTLNKGASLSDVYMSVLMPAAVGKPDNTVLFGPGGIIPNGYSQNSGLDLNKDGKITKAEATKKVEAYLPKTKPSVSPDKGMGGPSVDPSQIAPEARAALASNISQPPPSQSSQPQVNILPIDMTGGQQMNQGTPTVSPPPQQQKRGPSVPFLPSSNTDNFLVLYSKMVYNIVDG